MCLRFAFLLTTRLAAARPVPGRPPRLGPLQMRKLWTLIVGADPRRLQFDFALWTCDMVRELN